MINFANPRSEYFFLKKKIDKQISNVLRSNSYILGKEVNKFEKNFCKINNSKYAVGVSSGTDALIISLKSLDIKKGEKILVPSHTAIATIASIVEIGAIPLFCDVKEDFTIDFNSIPQKYLKYAKP